MIKRTERKQELILRILPQDLTVVDLVSLERRVLKTGYSAHTMGVAYSLDGSKVRGGRGGGRGGVI